VSFSEFSESPLTTQLSSFNSKDTHSQTT
jgi:hypothetical protein